MILRPVRVAHVVTALILGLIGVLVPGGPTPGAAASVGASAPRFEVKVLPTLGGRSSFARDLNQRREVTGNASTPAGWLVAARWSEGTVTPLGVLPASNQFSRGYAINARGVIVGESGNEMPRAFRWEDGELTDLGTLGGASAVAHGVDDAGRVVGVSSNGFAGRPFLYRGGEMADLGTLAADDRTPGRAWDIANSGHIVGLSRNDAGTPLATRWRVTGARVSAPVPLGSAADGVGFSQAFAVNERGVAVGEYSTGAGHNAVRWTADGAVVPLTGLGRRHARALDVNARGEVVGHVTGFYSFSGIDGRAVLWSDGSTWDLNELVPEGTDIVLQSAEGINDRGDIVGFRRSAGASTAFLLERVP